MKRIVLVALLLVAALGGLYAAGKLPFLDAMRPDAAAKAELSRTDKANTLAPAVTVAQVAREPFVEKVLVTGSIVARSEILVSSEVDGLRVLSLEAEEGDRVVKGQVLARLESDTLAAQAAQNDAGQARASAAIAQARSGIAEAEARLAEAEASLGRATPLRKSGTLSQSVFDQREAAARMARAQADAARWGIKAAEAELAQLDAQRRELDWRLSRTQVRAPAGGLVSRRAARIGAVVSAAGEPLFRIIEDGEIELEAEVPEAELAKLRPGQEARIEVAGVGVAAGKVRLVSSEVDRATRLGHARIFLGERPGLRLGAFGRGMVVTARTSGLAIPASALMYSEDGARVQVVRDGVVETRTVEVGLVAGGLAQIHSGLSLGEQVVAKAGTFLRDGEAVRPIPDPVRKLSEVN